MKKLILIVGVFVVLFGCSTAPKPRMVHSQSGAKYKSYRKLIEEKRNVLLSFEGYEGYEALVWSDDIKIFDYNLLGFIPIYRNLNIFMVNGEEVLLKDIPQGIKVLNIILIPKTDNRAQTQSKNILNDKIKRLRGKIRLNIGIEENAISITDPENASIQQIVHIERGVSLRRQKKEEKNVQIDKNNKVNTPDEYFKRLGNN